MDDLLFRTYQARDLAACLRLFDGNAPEFCAAHERAEFLAFLHEVGPWPYLVGEARLQAIRLAPQVKTVVIKTSQRSAGFYDRLGFRVTVVAESGFGPGLGQWVMVLGLCGVAAG